MEEIVFNYRKPDNCTNLVYKLLKSGPKSTLMINECLRMFTISQINDALHTLVLQGKIELYSYVKFAKWKICDESED